MQSYVIFPCAVLVLASTALLRLGPPVAASSLYARPPESIDHFSFGERFALADAIWLRAIQDFDFCEKKDDKGFCSGEGWVYRTVLAVSQLDPKFEGPVKYGALVLSVIVKDEAGASKIFDRGVTLFPDDWRMLYPASYQALFVEKNNAKAAELLERAGQKGAPTWVFALAGKLYSKEGQDEFAKHVLEEIESNPQIPEDRKLEFRQQILKERESLPND